MRVFVGGGAGFVGSHMVDRLMADGHEVTVFDNLSSGRMELIEHHLDNKNFHFIKGDLLDLPLVKESIRGHDRVVHLATNTDISKSVNQTDLDLRLGVFTAYNVLEAMRLSDISEIVFFSGSGVYGDEGDYYFPEDFGPLLPRSLYGASKLACEGLISAFCYMFGMKSWIFRPANLVGPRQTHGVIYDFINKLKKNPSELHVLGNGRQSKSYIHIEDVMDAVFFVLKSSDERVSLFNIASEDYIEVRDIARIVVEQMKLDAKITYGQEAGGWVGDVPVYRLDISKIKKLGWKPKYNSRQAVTLATRQLLGLE